MKFRELSRYNPTRLVEPSPGELRGGGGEVRLRIGWAIVGTGDSGDLIGIERRATLGSR